MYAEERDDAGIHNKIVYDVLAMREGAGGGGDFPHARYS